jgi:hypothetical protein
MTSTSVDVLARAKTISGMLTMGEPIAFGSDAAIIDELIELARTLSDKLASVEAERDELRGALEPFAIGPQFSLSGGRPDPHFAITLYGEASREHPHGQRAIIKASDFARARSAMTRSS